MSGPRNRRTQRGDHRNDWIPGERAADEGVAGGDVAVASHPTHHRGVVVALDAVALDVEQVPPPEGAVEGDVAQETHLELVVARDGALQAATRPDE